MKKYLLGIVLLLACPTLSHAVTWYVATTGSDSNTCTQAQNAGTPKLTILAGLTCVGFAADAGAGDVVQVAAGTYIQTLDSWPSGSSWASPFILRAAPGATVWVQASSSPHRCGTLLGIDTHYIEMDGINCEAVISENAGVGWKITYTGGGYPATGAHHIRIKNAEIRNGGDGILATCEGCEFQNLNVHHNGTNGNQDHGVYLSGNGNLLENSNIHENGGYGIHWWNSSSPRITNGIIRNNRIWGNGVTADAAGIILGYADNNQVYNNLIYGNRGPGISIKNGATGNLIYNNTIYGQTGTYGYCAEFVTDSTGTVFKNNLCYANSNNASFDNTGGGVTSTNNLCGSAGTSCQVIGNPLLTNGPGQIFTLQTGSAAINAGANLFSAGLTTDFAGVARPSSGAFEIGAYEFAAVDTTPPTTSTKVPAASATGVSLSTTVTVLFSEAMNVATVTSTTFTLKNGATSVPASVTCNTPCTTATLTPTSALIGSTVYTANVVSGASGVKDVAGNALVSDATWTFTTTAPIGPLTLYVGKTGSDANNCNATVPTAQSASTPKLTIAAAFACIGTAGGAGAGSVIQIATGDYAEHLNESVNGGTTWANALIVRAAPSATVWLKPVGGAGTRCITLGTTDVKQYVIFDGINCDAAAGNGSGLKLGGFNATSGFIQITNAEIKNATAGLGNIEAAGTDILIDHSNIHHSAATKPGMTIASKTSIIEHNNIHDNGWSGTDNYSGAAGVNTNIYRYNTFHNNAAAGLLIGSGNAGSVYNNLIYTNAGQGVYVGFGGTGNLVYNNTIWNNTSGGSGQCVYIDATQTSTIVRNNICYQNTSDAITDLGATTTASNNLFTNPSFTNTAVADFTLIAGSGAIDTGFTVAAVTDDYIGIARPQGAAYDIGAYEWQNPNPTVLCD